MSPSSGGGGQAEGLWCRCGDVVGVKPGVFLVEWMLSERGNRLVIGWLWPLAVSPGKVGRRSMVVGRGGGSVVVRGRESRSGGEGSQRAGREDVGMSGDRRWIPTGWNGSC